MKLNKEYNLDYYLITLTNRELLQEIRLSKELLNMNDYQVLYGILYNTAYIIKNDEVLRVYDKTKFKKATKKLGIKLTK